MLDALAIPVLLVTCAAAAVIASKGLRWLDDRRRWRPGSEPPPPMTEAERRAIGERLTVVRNRHGRSGLQGIWPSDT